MPAGFVSGPEGEKQWERAKKAAKEQYGDIEKSNPDKFFALVTTIYKAMCEKHNCGTKGESVGTKMRDLIEGLSETPNGQYKKGFERGMSLHSHYGLSPEKIKERLVGAEDYLEQGRKELLKWATQVSKDGNVKDQIETLASIQRVCNEIGWNIGAVDGHKKAFEKSSKEKS
jgi:hypothetical protein